MKSGPTLVSMIKKASIVTLMTLLGTQIWAASTTLSVRSASPYITAIKAKSCVTPGKSSISVYGRYFGSSYRKSLIAYSGRTRLRLKPKRWSTRYIVAYIPASRIIRPGQIYNLRIEYRSRTGRLLRSNSRRAFTICRRAIAGRFVKPVSKPPRIPARIRTPVRPPPGRGKITSPRGGSTKPGGRAGGGTKPGATGPNIRAGGGTTPPSGPNGNQTTPDPANGGGDNDPSYTGSDRSSPSEKGAGIASMDPKDKTSPPPTIPRVKNKRKFVTRQVMLTSKNMVQANKLYSELTKKGYKIVTRRNYRGLGLVLTILRTPDGVSANQAIAKLRKKYKKSAIDRNTIYTLHAGKPETLKYMKRISWSEPSANCGRGLKIGLLDSAIDTSHKAFRSRTIIQKIFTIAGSAPASRLHGTAIASQWLGNPKSGIAGIIPGATVYSGAVFYKKGRQQLSNSKLLVDGLDWLILNRVDVINLSFGGQRNKVIERAVKKALGKGISVVASAGNGGPKGRAVYPAAQPGVVAVTALTASNKIYAYATHGYYIDLAAPGVNIQVAKPGNGKKYVSGTSFSAPYVSAALLILKRRKNLRSHRARLQWLKRKAQSLGAAKTFGKGLLQVPGACRG